MNVFQIAIDGPVAAGKGSVSLGIAKRLGFLYVETGAMYRASAYLALEHSLALSDEKNIVALVQKHSITMRLPSASECDGRHTTVFLDEKDVSLKLRTEAISLAASKVAVLELLRSELVRQQRLIANSHDVVMEGRDIGTKVLPQAQLKIYLDADLSIRVDRRLKQLQTQGENLSREEVRAHIVERDTREMTRKIDPLHPAEDAWILDTTNLSIPEVIDQIAQKVHTLRTV